MTFNSAEIDRAPFITGQMLTIATNQTSRNLEAFSGVVSCIALVQDRLAPEYSASGPWRIVLFTLDAPTDVLARILLDPAVDSALMETADVELLSERPLSAFPNPSHDLFCTSQSQLHRKLESEESLPGDQCTNSRPGFDHDMDLPQAWGISKGDSSIVVAVVDGGYDLFHPVLGGPGPIDAVEDSLLYYNQGVWFRNWREVPGHAGSDTLPGAAGEDDDLDGYADEDAWGNLPGEPREADASLHSFTSVSAYTFTNQNANWIPGQFVGMQLRLSKEPYLNSTFYEIVRSNTVTEITTWGTNVIDMALQSELNGWEYFATTGEYSRFKLSNGVDDDGDGDFDDFGYVGSPDDDDENGFEDDIRGWDFVDSVRAILGTVNLSCDKEDYCNPDNDPRSMWDHGTSVASQIASAEASGRMIGIAPKVKILPIRAGAIYSCGATMTEQGLTWTGAGIDYARKMGADVISISIGPGSGTMNGFPTGAVSRALAAGIVVVAGAGNSVYDASIRPSDGDVVWVGGLDANDVRWNWGLLGESNYGSWVDVSAFAAPVTMAVWGALPYPDTYPNSWLQPSEWHGYGYEPVDASHKAHGGFGTSLAVPQVAGLAALVKSVYPQWGRVEIVNKIKLSTDNIYGTGLNDPGQTWLGTGRINAYKAITFHGNVAATGDTTWAHNIWIGGSIQVPAGRSLTIAAGDTVRVAIDDLLSVGPKEIEFAINGELHINGTSGAPVVFQTIDDPHLTWQYNTTVNVTGSTFTIGGIAQIETTARSPLMAGVSTASQVFSVGVSAASALDSVKLDLSGFGVSGTTLRLYDNGQGEDLTASDGIYTSGLFAASLTAGGTYSAAVTAYVAGGGYTRRDVAVEVPALVAKFVDVSSQTGLSYSGTPYSASSGKYGTVYEMGLSVVPSNAYARAFNMREILASGAPAFQAANFEVQVIGLRGVSRADYDNDGDEDLFVSHAQTPKLYRNDAGNFVDVTAAMGLATLAAGSTTGCWGDYDNDGWLDLFVTRSENLGGAEPPDYTNIMSAQHRLFRNTCGSGGGFVDATSSSGLTGVTPGSVAASWGDLNNDGNLDLIVLSAASPPSSDTHLYVNQGNGTFLDQFMSRMYYLGSHNVEFGTGVVWADMNNDGHFDIVTSCAGAGSMVYLNNGSGEFPGVQRVLLPPQSGEPGTCYSGLQVFDHNLDGWQDVLLLSGNPNKPSRVFLGKSTAGGGVEYVENTHNAGFSHTTKGIGSLAADFTGDGDMDLFVGRPVASGEFFYKTDDQSGANSLGQKYVKVRLVSPTADNVNREGIGATVILTAGSLVQTQMVDGGSGRGGQRDRTLTYGLGDYSGPVAATVRWPGGTVQSDITLIASGGGASEFINVISDATPVISNLSVATVVVPGTTFFDWVFSWDTDVACKAASDVLTIDQVNIANPCWPGWTTVTPSSGIPFVYEAKSGGGYRHKVLINHEECNLNCSFRYTVTSDNDLHSAPGPIKFKKVTFCPSGF